MLPRRGKMGGGLELLDEDKEWVDEVAVEVSGQRSVGTMTQSGAW